MSNQVTNTYSKTSFLPASITKVEVRTHEQVQVTSGRDSETQLAQNRVAAWGNFARMLWGAVKVSNV